MRDHPRIVINPDSGAAIVEDGDIYNKLLGKYAPEDFIVAERFVYNPYTKRSNTIAAYEKYIRVKTAKAKAFAAAKAKAAAAIMAECQPGLPTQIIIQAASRAPGLKAVRVA